MNAYLEFLCVQEGIVIPGLCTSEALTLLLSYTPTCYLENLMLIELMWFSLKVTD
jgi:hypothetical protein